MSSIKRLHLMVITTAVAVGGSASAAFGLAGRRIAIITASLII